VIDTALPLVSSPPRPPRPSISPPSNAHVGVAIDDNARGRCGRCALYCTQRGSLGPVSFSIGFVNNASDMNKTRPAGSLLGSQSTESTDLTRRAVKTAEARTHASTRLIDR